MLDFGRRYAPMREQLKMFFTFFKIGMFTLGGGYAMIPLIQREFVEKNKWIEEKQFLELLAMAQSSPGPIAVNSAVFIGYKKSGFSGSIIATLGITLPSFLIILIIAVWLAGFRDNNYVEAFFKGIRPAVTALIAAPIYSLGKSMQLSISGWLIAATAAIVVAFLNISPIIIIIIAAITGILQVTIKKPVSETGK